MRILWLFAALPVFAQPQATMISGPNVVRGTMTTSGNHFMGLPVLNAPYSAQRVTEHVQVAADGTRFTQTNQQEMIYRDSQGRTRSERPLGPPNNMIDAPVLIEIQDPVSGYGYTLDVQDKIAHRYQVKLPEMRRMPAGTPGGTTSSGVAYAASTGANTVVRTGEFNAVAPAPGLLNLGPVMQGRAQIKLEDLGEQVIEGVVVKGSRMTQTFATGTQGNDRPFSVVTETWMSAELKETVLSKNVDPRTGESTTKLVNVSRTEPSADLFMPPADFQVVDETGAFQIHWEGQRK